MIPTQMHLKKRQHKHLLWFVGFYAYVIIGCAVVRGESIIEPGILIVRNKSGVGILSVTLSAAGSPDRHKGRYGTISPVPRGASQVYLRPSTAPPLPKKIRISWVTDDSISYTREISLVQAVESSRDPRANAMVFEVLAGEIVNVYFEKFSDSRSIYPLREQINTGR